MADTKSTVNMEREPADRFPKARVAYVVWTKAQGKTLRANAAAREAILNPTEPDPPSDGVSVEDRFNA